MTLVWTSFFNHGAGSGGGGALMGNAVIYTGNGSTQSVTGMGFQPDLLWFKQRTLTTVDPRVVDSTRGVTLANRTNTNNQDVTDANGVTAFGSDGFSLGNSTSFNASGEDMLALGIKKVTNAFDIVGYTGTGSTHTEAHSLGVVPELIIVKNRGTAATNWAVYPGVLSSPGTKFLVLHTTAAVSTASTLWNNTDATSAVFTVATSSSVNANAQPHTAYLFASVTGYSKIGTYTGSTGSPPAVNCGFMPRIVIIKRHDSTGNWVVFDRTRDTSSPHGIYSFINSTAAEGTVAGGGGLDFTSSGFQHTGTDSASINVNAGGYIFMAFC